MIAALMHGVPSLLQPLGADQFYNAFRVDACGAGRTQDRSYVTPEDVRRAARALLDEPLYRLNAQRLAREIEAMPATRRRFPLGSLPAPEALEATAQKVRPRGSASRNSRVLPLPGLRGAGARAVPPSAPISY